MLNRLNLDYRYWAERNSYYSPYELTSSTRIGLIHGQKAKDGLNREIVSKISTNFALFSEIETSIKSKEFSSLYGEDELLLIFDLIQTWGGKMGKTPYVKPKGNIFRDQKVTH